MEQVAKRSIHKHTDGSFECVEDMVAHEKKVRISVNGNETLSLYCTPNMIRELVVGLMMTEGIIKGGWCADRMTLDYSEEEIFVDIPAEGEVSKGSRVITSGCVGGITFDRQIESALIEDDFRITGEDMRGIFRDFQSRSELYKLTGCIHSAALSDGASILCFAEDIGRHNAVDKVIGYALLENIPFSGKIMLASGRISSEISSKCSRWSIPVLVTRTAPTNRALEIADKRGVTVVGFMRGSRFNVYTHPERIV